MGAAKNKKKDIGLEFLQRIHFTRRNGHYGVADGLTRLYGNQKTEEFFNTWGTLGDGTTEFYNFKNQNIDISTIISENYDSNIIRQLCNYLYAQKEYINGEVLEVGCESGYVTAFLAMYFPEAHITAVDRSESAVSVAKERLERLGITNVIFEVADIKNVHEQYDTVISMRTLMENIATSVIDRDIFQGAEFDYQFVRNREEVQNYADNILALLKDEGHLISAERLPVSPLVYGWLSAFNIRNCAFLQNTFQHINCAEVETTGRFTAFVAQKGIQIDDGLIRRFVIDDLLNANNDYGKWTGKTNCIGWTAISYFLEHKGERVVDNYIIEKDEGYLGCVGRAAAYVDKDDATKLLYFRIINTFNNATTEILDLNKKDQITSKIETWTKEQENIGFERSSEWPITESL